MLAVFLLSFDHWESHDGYGQKWLILNMLALVTWLSKETSLETSSGNWSYGTHLEINKHCDLVIGWVQNKEKENNRTMFFINLFNEN